MSSVTPAAGPIHLGMDGPCGANATEKAASLIASMAAGADSIGDMDLLRGGAMGTVVSGVRAPSRLGSPLYSYKWGTSASSTNLWTHACEPPPIAA